MADFTIAQEAAAVERSAMNLRIFVELLETMPKRRHEVAMKLDHLAALQSAARRLRRMADEERDGGRS